MSALAAQPLAQFALDVAEGLASPGQKKISPHCFYDELGSALFEAITLLPEYGLTRADERLLQKHSGEIAQLTRAVNLIGELGSGSGRKTTHILTSMGAERSGSHSRRLVYSPIDVSPAALAACARQLGEYAAIKTICADWLEGVKELAKDRSGDTPLLLLFLGSSIGNLPREDLVDFFKHLRAFMRAGDYFLLGADLVKDVETMLSAYDDPAGVTAAFNLNLLGRMNRELSANFDLRSFTHEVRWNSEERRIEMHLLSCRNQVVQVEALKRSFRFSAGETIWTESSHKFSEVELAGYADAGGFDPVRVWIDQEWLFAELLWRAKA